MARMHAANVIAQSVLIKLYGNRALSSNLKSSTQKHIAKTHINSMLSLDDWHHVTSVNILQA